MKNKMLRLVKDTKSYISKTSDKYRIAGAVQRSWGVALVSASDLSHAIASAEFFKSLNSLSNEVTKAMDSGWKPGFAPEELLKFVPDLKFMPNNHRILDGGHTISEAFSRAFTIGEQQGWSDLESFTAGAKAYLSDLSSNAGMPALGVLSDDIYALLRSLGMNEKLARDIVTINGQEAVEMVLGGTLSAVSLVLSWSKEDKEEFSRVLAAVGITGAIALNPIVLAMVVVVFALNYHKLVCRKAMARGAFITGTGLAVSALVPGPLWVGVIPAIVATIYVKKKITKDVDIVEILRNLQKRETREQLLSTLKQVNEDLMSLVPKQKEST